MIAMIQLANAIVYSKKRSPFGLALFTGLNVIQWIMVYSYDNAFYTEVAIRTDGYQIPSFGHFSINFMIAGAIFYVLATVFSWFYVDWKYVKIED